MPDTGIAKVSTAKKSQFKAMQYKMLEIKLDTTCANEITIYFESVIRLSSIGIVQVFISSGIRNFHIIDISMLFLLCLKDMDIVGTYLNNITNQFIYQDSKSISIFCN